MIQERVGLLLQAIMQKGELLEENIKIIEDFFQKSIEYISIVVSLEITRLTAKNYLNGEDYRRFVEEMDRKRNIKYYNLLTSLQIINRLCDKCETQHFYVGADDHAAIGEFAGKVVQDLFSVGNVRPKLINLNDSGGSSSLETRFDNPLPKNLKGVY